ncbi:MAG: translocation/assembly module TamB domain-containing protein [Rhabdochlamydiaceae bacterium]
MTFRFLFKMTRLTIIGIGGLVLLFCVLFAVLQSKWAKEQIKERIISYLDKAGIAATIETLSGQPPFSWTIEEADLHFNDDNTLKLTDVKLRIAILPLLKGKMVINYLKAESATYIYYPSDEKQSKSWLQKQIGEIHLPCPIDIHHLKVAHVDLLNCKVGSKLSFAMTAAARIDRSVEKFLVDLTLFSPDDKKTYLEAHLDGSRPNDLIETEIKVHLDAIPKFLASIDEFESQIAAEFSLKGPWTTWKEIFYDLPLSKEPLTGEFKGMLTAASPKNLDILNRDWKFKADFSLSSATEAHIQRFLLLSDLIHMKGKGILDRELEKSKVVAAFSLPDLSQLPAFPSLLVLGSAQGKAFYQEGAYKASFQTQNLQIDSFAAKTLRGLIKGNQENNDWEGKVILSSSDADLPFKSSFAFEYAPEKLLSITGFNLKIAEATARGHFSYDMAKELCNGALFASGEHLDPLTSFFKDENLGGSFSAECFLSSEEDEQNVNCVIHAKNFRFRDYLLEDLAAHVEIEDLFDLPSGQFNIVAEKVQTPNYYLDQLNFDTRSDEANWPFSLKVEGRIENPFHLSATGFWNKENSLFSLELIQLFGTLSETPFSLKYPCEFEWGSDSITLSPLDLLIGDGKLYSAFEFSPIRSFGKWDLAHFPLEILRCFQPRFKLKGFVSAGGFFDAMPENIEGNLNLVLEEIDLLHFGKETPFRAKGTLQAHLNQNMLQTHTDLQATDEQFLDFNASLPIHYQLYPFQITFDESKNTSAELVAEGKLQDLFDFVNLGTNNFTGLLSCRLFLSHTLASPSLQGKLEWQNGSYDNYFTGMSLRNIDAQFEAKSDTIHLLQLNANDDKKGKISAQGKILLKPEEFFPCAFDAELHHLHVLGFDMIDCDLTGPLYLSGDMRNMLAQGNLLIDEAAIHITERLPYEVPTLPFTYINRPSHLYSRTIKPRPGFVFHIDLELTAEGNVVVSGRGLNAELEGDVHLHGANTNIAATGSLKLIKGDYQFSGKVFKLTEGEIVFNDKPAPSAYLNLNGTLSLPDVTITAMLRGPLESPQLTFNSNPQKPTSSILALILFNKDIADISHLETVQLANTLVSLSGGAAPDVLEAIRKSIGVDRLNISSKPGTDELALQIGKYLTRGIMITLSQSATSSQVIVEVELPKGFVFQAETQEEEEGKFSLKWRRSY